LKYQAQIRHINGDIITTIWDTNKRRFEAEIKKAQKNLAAYIGTNPSENDNLYLVIV
jgi:hypothetical protein